MPTFSNQAQLSYNGITANSNIAYGQILEVLAASKTALSDTYTSGDRITISSVLSIPAQQPLAT